MEVFQNDQDPTELEKLIENETKLIILEFLRCSSLPETGTVEVDNWNEVTGLNENISYSSEENEIDADVENIERPIPEGENIASSNVDDHHILADDESLIEEEDSEDDQSLLEEENSLHINESLPKGENIACSLGINETLAKDQNILHSLKKDELITEDKNIDISLAEGDIAYSLSHSIDASLSKDLSIVHTLKENQQIIQDKDINILNGSDSITGKEHTEYFLVFGEGNKEHMLKKSVHNKDTENRKLSRTNSHFISYEDFFERRERLLQWHLRKRERLNRATASLEGKGQSIAVNNHTKCKKDDSPARASNDDGSYLSNENNKTEMITRNKGNTKWFRIRKPSEKFNKAKQKLEQFLKSKLSSKHKVDTISKLREEVNSTSVLKEIERVDKDNGGKKDYLEITKRENSHMSYEKYHATREKLKQMSIPLRKSCNKELKKELNNFVNVNTLPRRHNKKYQTEDELTESYTSFLATREKIKWFYSNKKHISSNSSLFSKYKRKDGDKDFKSQSMSSEKFRANREKLKEKLSSETSNERHLYRQKRNLTEAENEHMSKKEEEVKQRMKMERKPKGNTFEMEKSIATTSSKDDNYTISKKAIIVDDESNTSTEESPPVSPETQFTLLMPDCDLFQHDHLLSPEANIVKCLEAISNDIMLNHPKELYGAINDLLSPFNQTETMSYDMFLTFAKKLYGINPGKTFWYNIGILMSVVREALMWGNLTDKQVEMVVEHITKFVTDNPVGEETGWIALLHKSYTLYDQEIWKTDEDDNDNTIGNNNDDVIDNVKVNCIKVDNVVYDWIPYGIAILTVGIALAYSFFKT